MTWIKDQIEDAVFEGLLRLLRAPGAFILGRIQPSQGMRATPSKVTSTVLGVAVWAALAAGVYFLGVLLLGGN